MCVVLIIITVNLLRTHRCCFYMYRQSMIKGRRSRIILVDVSSDYSNNMQIRYGWLKRGCRNKSNVTRARTRARTLVSELISFKFVLRASPFCLLFFCAKRFRHKLLMQHCKFTRDFFALPSRARIFFQLHALRD